MQLRVYKDNQLLTEENTCDPIQDMAVSENFVFTVKDLDVTITELIPGEKVIATSKKTIVGKAPVTIAGNKLVFASRSGKDILVHENSSDVGFKLVTEIKACL